MVGRGILATEESRTNPSIPAVVWVMEELRSKTFVPSAVLARRVLTAPLQGLGQDDRHAPDSRAFALSCGAKGQRDLGGPGIRLELRRRGEGGAAACN